jgi:hypothetical protein
VSDWRQNLIEFLNLLPESRLHQKFGFGDKVERQAVLERFCLYVLHDVARKI